MAKTRSAAFNARPFFQLGIIIGVMLLASTARAQAKVTEREPYLPAVTAPVAPPRKDLGITITLSKSKFVAAEPIIAHVKITNLTAEQRDLPTFMPFNDSFSVSVQDGQGKLMPLTRYGIARSTIPLGKNFRGHITVPAAGEYEAIFVINRIVDLTRAGQYMLLVSFPVVESQEESSMLSAEPIHFSVTESEIPTFTDPPTNGIGVETLVVNPPIKGFPWTENPVKSWQNGDTWLLSLELDDPNGPEIPLDLPKGLSEAERELFEKQAQQKRQVRAVARYFVRAQIIGEKARGGRDFWIVQLLPSDAAAGTVRINSCTITVDKQTGLIEMLTESIFKRDNPLLSLGGLSVLFPPKFGYSVELLWPITRNIDAKSEKINYRLTASNLMSDAESNVEAHLFLDEKEQIVIKEKWTPGAKWWTQYELEDKNTGRILRAKQVQIDSSTQKSTN